MCVRRPERANMLTLAMRRERDDSATDDYQGLFVRQRSRDSDEFVDILQVQQLLIENSAGAGAPVGATRPRPSRPPPGQPSRTLLDTLPPGPPYYYGSYQHTQPCSNVEDLVAMWFAGSSSAGVYHVAPLAVTRSPLYL